MRIGLTDAKSYPLALVMRVIALLVPVVTFFFVAEFVDVDNSTVAFDYYTFVIIGVVAMAILDSGLRGFAGQITTELSYGRLEMYLVEPVRWRVLPFVMVQWPLISTFALVTVMLAASLFLGAHYSPDGILPALAIIFLGVAASLAIGVIAAAVRVLAKRADPIIALYTLAASVFSGVFYPVSSMPEFLQKLSLLIPHTYAIQALRRVLMPAGESLEGPSAGSAMLALAVFSVIAYPIALWLYMRSMEYGRRMGILTGY